MKFTIFSPFKVSNVRKNLFKVELEQLSFPVECQEFNKLFELEDKVKLACQERSQTLNLNYQLNDYILTEIVDEIFRFQAKQR